MITLDPRATALVLIDLQAGILALPTAPRSGSEILSAAKAVAGRFRSAGALVAPVRVDFAPDFADAPPQLVDQPMTAPPGGRPANWAVLAEGIALSGDIVITKHQWGAFTGTELDLQLRRRAIKNVVVGGIATNFGVESTVRHAWELGYNVVVAEDLCATFSVEMHEFAIQRILPRLARIVSSDAIAFG